MTSQGQWGRQIQLGKGWVTTEAAVWCEGLGSFSALIHSQYFRQCLLLSEVSVNSSRSNIFSHPKLDQLMWHDAVKVLTKDRYAFNNEQQRQKQEPEQQLFVFIHIHACMPPRCDGTSLCRTPDSVETIKLCKLCLHLLGPERWQQWTGWSRTLMNWRFLISIKPELIWVLPITDSRFRVVRYLILFFKKKRN